MTLHNEKVRQVRVALIILQVYELIVSRFMLSFTAVVQGEEEV